MVHDFFISNIAVSVTSMNYTAVSNHTQHTHCDHLLCGYYFRPGVQVIIRHLYSNMNVKKLNTGRQ